MYIKTAQGVRKMWVGLAARSLGQLSAFAYKLTQATLILSHVFRMVTLKVGPQT